MHGSVAAKLLLCIAGVALWSAAPADQDPQIETKVAALLARMIVPVWFRPALLMRN